MNEVKVGAPEVISGSQNSNVELTVQSMLRCREITLAEGATSEGNIKTVARLLGQLREELQAKTEQKALRVGFESKEAAFAYAHVGDDEGSDGTMWQQGEEVVVKGLRLFVVRGKEKEAYALVHGVDMESVEDGAVTAWVGEIRYGSVADSESDGDIPVKDELVWWSCSDGKEGTMANGFPQGMVKGSYFLGSVRGALKANPQMAHADMCLALGLGNCTSEEWTEGMKLLAQKEKLAEVLTEYPDILDVVIKNPQVVGLLLEWPDVINSLKYTGKTNWLKSDGVSLVINNERISNILYENQGGHIKLNMRFLAMVGNWDNCYSMLNTAINSERMYASIYPNGRMQWGMHTSSDSLGSFVNNKNYSIEAYTFSRQTQKFIVDGVELKTLQHNFNYPKEHYRLSFFSLSPIMMDRAILYDKKDNIIAELIPFIRDGVSGLFDLVSMQFFSNSASADKFTIITENV